MSSWRHSAVRRNTMKDNNRILKSHQRRQLVIFAIQKLLTAKNAAEILNISERQFRRLIRQFRLKGILNTPPRCPWNGITEKVRTEIVKIKKENPSRSNQHIAELLQQRIKIKLCRETVRRTLINQDCYEKTKTKRRVFRNMEKKITHCGQMVQFDVCEGAWLKGYRRVYLIAFIDAYSRYIVGWKWVDTNNAWNNISVLRSMTLKYGVPEIFYTDNASFYKVIRHNDSAYQKHKPEDEYETTMQRIILDLGSVMVNHKPYQPQGKGRIERFFRFMQDRFIKEHTAENLEELNKQFKVWVKWYNAKHIIRTIECSPKDRFNPKEFKPVPKDLNLEKVFSYQYTRKVDKYNSFSFEGISYLIDSKNCKHFNGCLVACWIQLYVRPKTIIAYHQNRRIQKFKRLFKKS